MELDINTRFKLVAVSALMTLLLVKWLNEDVDMLRGDVGRLSRRQFDMERTLVDMQATKMPALKVVVDES